VTVLGCKAAARNINVLTYLLTLRDYNSPRKLLRIATTNGGCAVNGTAVATVLIDKSRSFMNLDIRYVHWIAAIAKFGFFVANTWQHLPHLLLEV